MTKAFDSEGVCRIIEVCAKSGVKTFTGFGMKVSFVDVAQTPALESVYIPEAVRRAADSQAKESQEIDEQLLKSAELEQMVIEDPAKYEELIKSGDLDNEKA